MYYLVFEMDFQQVKSELMQNKILDKGQLNIRKTNFHEHYRFKFR